jgi:hypothetical protein
MEPEHNSPRRSRENIIILTLTLFVGGILMFFLDLISLGIFTYAVLIGGAIFLLGSFHYLAWGRAMSEQVADERRALLAQEEEDANPGAEGIQDLSRRRGIQRRRPGE